MPTSIPVAQCVRVTLIATLLFTGDCVIANPQKKLGLLSPYIPVQLKYIGIHPR